MPMLGNQQEWEEDLVDLIFGDSATSLNSANELWSPQSQMYLAVLVKLYPVLFPPLNAPIQLGEVQSYPT